MRPEIVLTGRQLQRVAGGFIICGVLLGDFAMLGGGLVLLCLGRGAVHLALTLP